jgi:A/G-specific adenine glycosylase
MTDEPGAEELGRRERVWRSLLSWYARSGRALPWRQTRDPYAVLVSEIMLQQTQVERVLPKYHEFLERFPTLAALAGAAPGDVIRTWAPLGYNVRAVRLRQIAQQAVERCGGSLPHTLDGLLALNGIGRYTAGAIACFAYELPVATVDTNIRRVLWRVFRGIEPAVWPTGQTAARDALTLAEWALPADRAYDWQQGLMDLGALICSSRQPKCERCPLAADCAALAATARATLFPSGEALTRLRDATPNTAAASARDGRRVAEAQASYAAPAGSARARGAKQPFTSTSRYFRGRILALLREREPGATLALAEIGPRLKPDWRVEDIPWLASLVAGLARDGLVMLEDEPADAREDVGSARLGLP